MIRCFAVMTVRIEGKYRLALILFLTAVLRRFPSYAEQLRQIGPYCSQQPFLCLLKVFCACYCMVYIRKVVTFKFWPWYPLGAPYSFRQFATYISMPIRDFLVFQNIIKLVLILGRNIAHMEQQPELKAGVL